SAASAAFTTRLRRSRDVPTRLSASARIPATSWRASLTAGPARCSNTRRKARSASTAATDDSAIAIAAVARIASEIPVSTATHEGIIGSVRRSARAKLDRCTRGCQRRPRQAQRALREQRSHELRQGYAQEHGREHGRPCARPRPRGAPTPDRKSTRLNSSHVSISYAVFCLKKKKNVKDKSAMTMAFDDGVLEMHCASAQRTDGMFSDNALRELLVNKL